MESAAPNLEVSLPNRFDGEGVSPSPRGVSEPYDTGVESTLISFFNLGLRSNSSVTLVGDPS